MAKYGIGGVSIYGAGVVYGVGSTDLYGAMVPVRADNRYIALSPYDSKIPVVGPMSATDKWAITLDWRAGGNATGPWDVNTEQNPITVSTWDHEAGQAGTVSDEDIDASASKTWIRLTNMKPGSGFSLYRNTITTAGPSKFSRRVMITTTTHPFYYVAASMSSWEEYWLTVDFAAKRNGNGITDWLTDGEYLIGHNATASGVTIDSTQRVLDNTAVLLKLSSGTEGTDALIQLTGTTSGGDIKLVHIKVPIRKR